MGELRSDTNYLVSGLERSGTSMMMQILAHGGLPVAFDRSREPDVHNPRGYYELEGGKIINRLMDGTFPFEKYYGTFIKVTAYGLKFLPKGCYKAVYMLRDLDEIMDSMEKMSGDVRREQEKPAFRHLNRFAKQLLRDRDDIDVLMVQYRDVVEQPREEAARVSRFLEDALDVEEGIAAVDPDLYRNVKK
ncbi:MAG: sulfotransferase domain-containing protein [Candidatus Thermoplasmatota archaeon]|nr:sulfotransferase domain-containing protein [Candidatus Thermoplasmatota archaeon]